LHELAGAGGGAAATVAAAHDDDFLEGQALDRAGLDLGDAHDVFGDEELGRAGGVVGHAEKFFKALRLGVEERARAFGLGGELGLDTGSFGGEAGADTGGFTLGDAADTFGLGVLLVEVSGGLTFWRISVWAALASASMRRRCLST